MSEKLEGTPRPKEEQDFNSQFPMDQFDKGTQWTKQGSPEGLRDKVMEAMESCLRGTPQKATIQFERLPDGGYEIRYARTRV